MLPFLQGTPARIVAVSSMGHQLQDMNIDDLVGDSLL